MVLPDDQGDLHIPHYINLFGGTVFLEPLGRFEKRLRKAFAATAGRHDDPAIPTRSRPTRRWQAAARLIHESGHNRLPVVEDGTPRRRGHAPGRAGRPRRVTEPERALARIDLGAIERNCATCARCWRRHALCAVVKADAYGHGALEAAGPRWRAARPGWRWPPPREAAELRGRGRSARDPRDGRAHARGAADGHRGGRGRRGVDAARSRAAGRRACT